jgi:uncharacterized protein YbjT (DUF2867 family)
MVLLTGASGRIGAKVLRRLLEKGVRVRALVHRRRPKGLQLEGQRPEGVSGPNLEVVEGDILDQETMKGAVRGCSYVAHLAAAWGMFPPAQGLHGRLDGRDPLPAGRAANPFVGGDTV